MTLQELRARREELYTEQNRILRSYETSGVKPMPSDIARLAHMQSEHNEVDQKIKTLESKNSITHMNPLALMGGPSDASAAVMEGSAIGRPRVSLPSEYPGLLGAYLKSRGKLLSGLEPFMDPLGGVPLFGYSPRPEMGAALYEGSSTAGGYAVPITVDDQIVPLAPTEMGVRKLSQVIPTTMDIKIPQKASFGTAAITPELSAFGGTATSLAQFTLTANMVGSQEQISWELAQDVPAFQAFVVDDMILAQQMEEEPLYLTGTGSGQPQGLLGNVGAGVTEELDSNNNAVTINGTLDLIGTLNAMYHPGAAWLMSRPTSIVIRKAQMEQNLFFPAWQRVGGQDYLHGYPVEFSGFMPTAARGNAPILFGDFKRGYIIGDRGGSGINVKVLDQPLATQGILILLAYRRTDGRVRRSEAIQQYNVALS
jgi:HK97 family phage major capsid protein